MLEFYPPVTSLISFWEIATKQPQKKLFIREFPIYLVTKFVENQRIKEINLATNSLARTFGKLPEYILISTFKKMQWKTNSES